MDDNAPVVSLPPLDGAAPPGTPPDDGVLVDAPPPLPPRDGAAARLDLKRKVAAVGLDLELLAQEVRDGGKEGEREQRDRGSLRRFRPTPTSLSLPPSHPQVAAARHAARNAPPPPAPGAPPPPPRTPTDADRAALAALASARLADLLHAAALSAVKHVQAHKWSWPFNAPVDEATYPTYREVVSNPIDLGTIRSRLESDARAAADAAAAPPGSAAARPPPPTTRTRTRWRRT